MISRYVIVVFLICVSITTVLAFEPGSDIDRYLTKRTEMGAFSGSVLVVKDGRMIIRKGYGYADIERRIPYTPETRQSVASLTKMFTSMAVLLLRDRGRLRLDDPICKYIDDCPAAWRPIIVQQLMRHTSGIPDYEQKLDLGSEKYIAYMKEPASSRRIVEEAKKLPLDFPAGEQFSYSNTAYIVLAMIIGRVSGESFEDFVIKNILVPAGMKTAGFVTVAVPRSDLAIGYDSENLPFDRRLAGVSLTAGHLKPLPVLPTSRNHGDGSLYMTPDDLYRWSTVMDGKSFIPEMDVREVFTPGAAGYGYGWFVGTGFDHRRARHNGAFPGYLTNIDKYPDDHLTIILFTNIPARLSAIARDVAAIALGKPWDMPVEGKVIKLTNEQIAALEGTYKMADGGILTIKDQPDYLTASIPGRYTAGLIPLSPTEFYFPLGDGKAIFTLADGKAVKINMRYSGEDHLGERIK